MINDSAGIEVPLIDKSERTSTAMGFRSAAVVEAVRGLCETPVLITSEAEYVKVFGAPSVSKTGMASIEAYSLSQRRVPQVVVRAKNPALNPSDRQFPVLSFAIEDSKLDLNDKQAANKIARPEESDTAALYFKGEGDYACGKVSSVGSHEPNKSNIVLRFSKPSEESAYADDKRVMHLQVFDFAGDSHIDNDQCGKLVFNPTLSDIIDGDGEFSAPLSDLLGIDGTAQVAEYKVVAYVNGRTGVASSDSGSSGESSSVNLWDAIAEAIADAKQRGGDKPVLPPKDKGWDLVADEQVTGSTDKYFRTLLDDEGHSLINAFDLSISLAITAKIVFTQADPSEEIPSAYLNVESGTVAVRGSEEQSGSYGPAEVALSLSTSAILIDRTNYMFVGEANSYWAAYYNAYLKESWDLSFSYDDYDASFTSLQADAVLQASNYLVCKTNDVFGDYEIKWGKKAEDGTWIEAPDDLVGKLQYFQCGDAITSNDIEPASKSYAYSQALSVLLGDNLTRWRCVCAPNLGDVMIKGDFVAAIEAAQECTLGLSNIGHAASVDVLNNLNGRHGNRFIADFSVYGYRSLNGRRTPFTMACLVAELLNRNFNNGNEARPPFGYTYGQVICNEISQTLTGPQRLMLARQYKVNPVIEDGGYYLWDERTSQEKETSLSDEHSILSFVWMKFQIYDTMKSFIAEYNDIETINRGLSKLNSLCQNWITKKYVEEALADANKNVIGDETLRFTVRVRFKGVARYAVVEVVAYPQTQALAISLAMEEAA